MTVVFAVAVDVVDVHFGAAVGIGKGNGVKGPGGGGCVFGGFVRTSRCG